MAVTRTSFAALLAAMLFVVPTFGFGESEELTRAKDLYRSASYDEALGVLDGLGTATGTDAIEINEYRVLCLVALDRRDDAKKAMAALVTAHPTYMMSEADAPPRVRTMFTDVRKSLLPSLIQRAYADAKTAFDKKDPSALAQFERVIALTKDPDVAGNASLADLATVANGFRDLSKALATPTPVPTPPPAEAPRAAAAAAPPAVVVPPVAISQSVPPPQSSVLREEREWNGSVEVTINEQGKVTAARMVAPIQPTYDQQLMRAAMTWSYKPALRDGVPTVSTKQITIHLDTRPVCTARSTGNCRTGSEE